MDEYEDYKRFPIQICDDTFILLHIYNRKGNHSFESAWLRDNQHYDKKAWSLYKDAADQFIKQLEGEECDAFIIALRDKCEEYLEENKKKLYESVVP